MKDQAIQYLAFDVHQATIVATHLDPGGSIIMRATIPTHDERHRAAECQVRSIKVIVKDSSPVLS
jgi:hypothetical protein